MNTFRCTLIVTACFAWTLSPPAVAGLFKIDFGELQNDIEEDVDDWDVIPTFLIEDFDDEIAQWSISDWSGGGDDDVTLTIIDQEILADELASFSLGMTANNPVPQFEEPTYDGVFIPAVVKDDYLYRNPDTAGSEMLFRLENLDPGEYSVTLFEGRVDDANGQYGKLWVSADITGADEPEDENTGNFAGLDVDDTGDVIPEGIPVTFPFTIAAGEYLWYAHMEDNSGGISGMIVRQSEAAGPIGDFDGNGLLDEADIEALSAKVREGTNESPFDVTGDGLVDAADRDEWIRSIRKTWFGDSNNDGVFDSGDFVFVFTVGEYEDADVGNSTWGEGDWNGDGDFDSSDFVTAFTDGGFEAGVRPAVSPVPEPSGVLLMFVAMALLVGRNRC